MKLPRVYRSSPDYLFIGTVVLVTVFGFVMLASASSDIARERFGDSSYYLFHQLLYGALPGVIGFIAGALVPYRFWQRFATPLLVVTLALLVLVLTPLNAGEINNVDRWLSIGSFSFQPSELVKLTFFIYLAAWMSHGSVRGKSFGKGFVPFGLLVGTVMLLLLLQPATTVAALVFLSSLLMYFTGGAKIRFLAVGALIACLALSIVILVTPYRLERVTTFFNPTEDLGNAGYHLDQALQAIGSGGIFGVGFGQSATKLHALPEAIGDSIFAVVGEEFGFVGSLAVLSAFFVLVWRGLRIARRTSDSFGRLLVIGCTCLIGIQAFVNIAAISGLVPLTGVPLPYVSYGGTALAVSLTMSGIIVNVSGSRS